MVTFDESLSRGAPTARTIKCFLSEFLLLWLLKCFLMGLVQTLQGAAVSQWPSLKKKRAPADHSSRQGGEGHRGRSYQGAAECEGQKSWCIQAHRTVTRHSSAQGPSEQAALTLNRLLMKSPAQGLSSKKHTRRKKALMSWRKETSLHLNIKVLIVRMHLWHCANAVGIATAKDSHETQILNISCYC